VSSSLSHEVNVAAKTAVRAKKDIFVNFISVYLDLI
jgi:hypothetical protein